MKKQSDLLKTQDFVTGKCRLVLVALLPLAFIVAGMLAGCQTQSQDNFLSRNALNNQAAKATEPITMREGDTVKVSFPGSPTWPG